MIKITPTEAEILTALRHPFGGSAPKTLPELQRATGLLVSELRALIRGLQFKGLVTGQAGRYRIL